MNAKSDWDSASPDQRAEWWLDDLGFDYKLGDMPWRKLPRRVRDKISSEFYGEDIMNFFEAVDRFHEARGGDEIRVSLELPLSKADVDAGARNLPRLLSREMEGGGLGPISLEKVRGRLKRLDRHSHMLILDIALAGRWDDRTSSAFGHFEELLIQSVARVMASLMGRGWVDMWHRVDPAPSAELEVM